LIIAREIYWIEGVGFEENTFWLFVCINRLYFPYTYIHANFN